MQGEEAGGTLINCDIEGCLEVSLSMDNINDCYAKPYFLIAAFESFAMANMAFCCFSFFMSAPST